MAVYRSALYSLRRPTEYSIAWYVRHWQYL